MIGENRVEGGLRELGGRIQDAAGGLTGDTDTQLRGKANQLGGQIQNRAGAAADEMHDAGRRIAAGVKDQPVGALLIAGVVGFALGLMIGR